MQVFNRLIWHQPYALLTLTIMFWCGNFVVGEYTTKVTEHPVPPIQLAFVRWVCAAIILFPLAARSLWTERKEIFQHFPVIWIIGVSAYSFYNTCIYLALSYDGSNATSLATLQTIFPAVVACLGFIIFGVRINFSNTTGIILAVLGGTVATSQGDLFAALKIQIGMAERWAFLAVLSYALYTVLLRLRPNNVSSVPFLWMLIISGLTLLTPWWAWDTFANGNQFPFSGEIVWALIYLAIFPSLISALCYNRAVQLIGPGAPSLSINLMPFGIAILFWISPLPSQLAWYHLLSLAMIFPGIWLIRKS